jgi:hypothetical protein
MAILVSNGVQSHLTLALPMKSPADAQALAQQWPLLMLELFKAADAMGTLHYSRFVALSDKTFLFLGCDQRDRRSGRQRVRDPPAGRRPSLEDHGLLELHYHAGGSLLLSAQHHRAEVHRSPEIRWVTSMLHRAATSSAMPITSLKRKPRWPLFRWLKGTPERR